MTWAAPPSGVTRTGGRGGGHPGGHMVTHHQHLLFFIVFGRWLLPSVCPSEGLRALAIISPGNPSFRGVPRPPPGTTAEEALTHPPTRAYRCLTTPPPRTLQPWAPCLPHCPQLPQGLCVVQCWTSARHCCRKSLGFHRFLPSQCSAAPSQPHAALNGQHVDGLEPHNTGTQHSTRAGQTQLCAPHHYM